MAWKEQQDRVDAQHQRFPPHSDAAESALIGVLIYLDEQRWKETSKQVPAEMFYDRWYRGLYQWLRANERQPWRFSQGRAFTAELHKAAGEIAGYEDLQGVSWRLAKLINHDLATLDALPGLLKTLRRLMVLRRKIAEAEKSLNEAWRQADAEEC